MMTEENIKEAIGLRFVEALVNYKGFKTSSTYPDHGTDLSIIEVDFRVVNDHRRYCDTGRELKVQLKTTTEGSITRENAVIKYDLEAKTFNDLIERKNNHRPLLLVLFVLPKDCENWFSLTDEELIIRKQAFWFYPDSSTKTENDRTIRISIPNSNLFSIDTIIDLFDNFA